MGNKKIPKTQMAANLGVGAGVRMQVVCSDTFRISFSKVPSSRNPELTQRFVSKACKARLTRIHRAQISDNQQHVNDRLGQNSSNGCASNMVARDGIRAENRKNPPRFFRKLAVPIRVVGNDSLRRRHGRASWRAQSPETSPSRASSISPLHRGQGCPTDHANILWPWHRGHSLSSDG